MHWLRRLQKWVLYDEILFFVATTMWTSIWSTFEACEVIYFSTELHKTSHRNPQMLLCMWKVFLHPRSRKVLVCNVFQICIGHLFTTSWSNLDVFHLVTDARNVSYTCNNSKRIHMMSFWSLWWYGCINEKEKYCSMYFKRFLLWFVHLGETKHRSVIVMPINDSLQRSAHKFIEPRSEGSTSGLWVSSVDRLSYSKVHFFTLHLHCIYFVFCKLMVSNVLQCWVDGYEKIKVN